MSRAEDLKAAIATLRESLGVHVPPPVQKEPVKPGEIDEAKILEPLGLDHRGKPLDVTLAQSDAWYASHNGDLLREYLIRKQNEKDRLNEQAERETQLQLSRAHVARREAQQRDQQRAVAEADAAKAAAEAKRWEPKL